MEKYLGAIVGCSVAIGSTVYFYAPIIKELQQLKEQQKRDQTK